MLGSDTGMVLFYSSVVSSSRDLTCPSPFLVLNCNSNIFNRCFFPNVWCLLVVSPCYIQHCLSIPLCSESFPIPPLPCFFSPPSSLPIPPLPCFFFSLYHALFQILYPTFFSPSDPLPIPHLPSILLSVCSIILASYLCMQSVFLPALLRFMFHDA